MGTSFGIKEARLDREILVAEISSIIPIGGWDPSFQNDVVEEARFVLARVIGLMRADLDCQISFERVSISSIVIINPLRVAITDVGGYPILRQRLIDDQTYDSIPLAIGKSRQGMSLWDGHRRLETYRFAERKNVPALVSTFRKGSGMITVPSC